MGTLSGSLSFLLFQKECLAYSICSIMCVCVYMREQLVQRLSGRCTYRQQYKLVWDTMDRAGRAQGRNDLDCPS